MAYRSFVPQKHSSTSIRRETTWITSLWQPSVHGEERPVPFSTVHVARYASATNTTLPLLLPQLHLLQLLLLPLGLLFLLLLLLFAGTFAKRMGLLTDSAAVVHSQTFIQNALTLLLHLILPLR